MNNWRRYAIYYTAPGPLGEFGAAWLGWDIEAGSVAARLGQHRKLPPRIDALTRTPRRYGFHATLKPPFRLHDDSSEDRLLDDLRDFAASQPVILLAGGLRIASLDGFPALIPGGPSQAVQDLAARVVQVLDRHRAPLSPEERARRAPERLTQAQRDLLDRWGYPWVLDQFRFHMTLGCRLPDDEVRAVIDALTPHLEPLLPDPHPIDALTLAGEDADGQFHQIARIALRV